MIGPASRMPLCGVCPAGGGSGAVRDIVEEMLALTRMNWNSADFATAEPITEFSRQIGLILGEPWIGQEELSGDFAPSLEILKTAHDEGPEP